MRIDRKAAHNFQSSRRILFPNGDLACKQGLDKTLAEHIAYVEQVVALRCWNSERARWLVVRAGRRHRDQLLLRVPQCSEVSSESTSRVDVHGVVNPTRLRHGHVAVNDQRAAPIVLRPIKADRKTKFVGFPGGFAVEREVTDTTRGATLHVFLKSGVRHD